jgi:Family of unknown function (DUF6221)
VTDDIVAFIRARLYDDQFSAELAAPDWPPGDEVAGQPESIRVGALVHRFNPDRVFRGVEAKRKIVAELDRSLTADPELPGVRQSRGWLMWATVHLVSEWSTHPDFRAEWTQ